MEDTSGRHEPSAFTSRWSRRPWLLPHADKGANATAREELETSAGRQSEGAASAAEEGDATEVSEAWSEQAPWEENAHALTQLPSGGAENEAKKGSACLAPIRRSVLECREALGPSIKSHEAQDFVSRASGASKRGDVHAVKAAE